MIRFVPIGGFLGAGKTTSMIAAAQRLEAAGEKVSVVTNDQGVDLVDTQLARAAGPGSVDEVTGGCFCCRFDDLAAVVQRLERDVQPTIVLAEAVGSCTDLQSTVVRPLRALYGDSLDVAPLVVLVDPVRYAALSTYWSTESEPDLAYLYRHQLDEADVIAINKTDLFGTDEIARIREHIHTHFPHARVIAVSATAGDGFDELLDIWAGTVPTESGERRAFAVDYDRYGAAEAELAWTNQTFDITASESTFVPAAWSEAFLGAFLSASRDQNIVIGHLKLSLHTSDGTTKASITSAEGAPTYDHQQWIPAETAAATLNARIAVAPDDLETLIASSTEAANSVNHTTSSARRGDIFRPGFPLRCPASSGW